MDIRPIQTEKDYDAVLAEMEQQGLKQKDLEPVIGSSGRVSEVLSGRRGLSIQMIRNLHRELGNPAEVLIRDSRAA